MTINWVKLGIGASILSVTLLVTIISYKHYSRLLEDNSALSATVAKLETALGVEQLSVLSLTESVKEWEAAEAAARKALAEQTRIASRAREELRRLDEIFSRHDLAGMARGKPDMVERRLNDGTARIFRMLECASGAAGCDARPSRTSP